MAKSQNLDPHKLKFNFNWDLFKKTSIEIGRTKKLENEEFVLYVKVEDAETIEEPFPGAKDHFIFINFESLIPSA